MVMIVLKKPVMVAVGDGNFVTVIAGSYVNYCCKKIDSHWHHWFHVYVKSLQRTAEFKLIGSDDKLPEWL